MSVQSFYLSLEPCGRSLWYPNFHSNSACNPSCLALISTEFHLVCQVYKLDTSITRQWAQAHQPRIYTFCFGKPISGSLFLLAIVYLFYLLAAIQRGNWGVAPSLSSFPVQAEFLQFHTAYFNLFSYNISIPLKLDELFHISHEFGQLPQLLIAVHTMAPMFRPCSCVGASPGLSPGSHCSVRPASLLFEAFPLLGQFNHPKPIL